jgi:YVTN family beta-propeller protein
MSFTCRRIGALAFLLVLTLAIGVFADHAYVTNRGGTTVNIFDTTSNLEIAGSPVTVGTGPIAIAADRHASVAPQQVYVANSGSNTVSVISNSALTVVATISTDSFFGPFQIPSGLTLVDDGVIGPTIAMVDQAITTYQFNGLQSGRSTIRFIDPATNSVVDAFQEPSASARYTDVVFTSDPSTGNRRIWISDAGDQGVTVIKLNSSSGPPFGLGQILTYQGSGAFADFVGSTAVTPTFMVAPRRLATNGTNRVVVADNGSKIVSILDANYVSTNTLGQPGAVLANVDLSTFAGAPAPAPAFTCVDVQVVGNLAYVTTSNAVGAGANCYQIDLTNFTILASVTLAGGTGVEGGLGVTSDGGTLFVGAGVSGSGQISKLTISPPASFTTAPTVIGPFTGGSFPFAFASSSTVAGGGGGGGGGGGSVIGVRHGNYGGCGLMGLEGALILLVFRRLRPKPKKA